MATIGIFDADMYKYIHVPFCLEAMKLAAYYKKKRDIVTMSLYYTPDKYTKFIYRKDYNDGDFPNNLYKLNNIEYGGTAFTSSYVPLPEDIEKYKPDVSIYKTYFNSFVTSYDYEQAFNTMYRAQHLRLSLDGRNIWGNYSKQLSNLSDRNTIFIHDLNVNDVAGAAEELQLILNKTKDTITSRKVGFKYPIRVNNIEDLFKWAQFNPTEKYFTISYEGLMADEAYYELIKKDLSNSYQRKIEYHITKNLYTEDEFIKQVLPKIYRQLIFSRQYHQYFLLKYDTDFFIDSRWYKVLDLLNRYAVSLYDMPLETYYKIIPYDSLYSFVKKIEERPLIKDYNFNKQDARDAFSLVREMNYDLFKDFYELHTVDLIGGEFK